MPSKSSNKEIGTKYDRNKKKKKKDKGRERPSPDEDSSRRKSPKERREKSRKVEIEIRDLTTGDDRKGDSSENSPGEFEPGSTEASQTSTSAAENSPPPPQHIFCYVDLKFILLREGAYHICQIEISYANQGPKLFFSRPKEKVHNEAGIFGHLGFHTLNEVCI